MAEKAILSLMLSDSSIFVRRALGEGLTSAMFYVHGPLFDALCAYFAEHGHCDLIGFIQSLHMSDLLDRCGGPSTIAEVNSYAVGNAEGWTVWVKQLRETFALRTAIKRATALTEAEDSDEAINEAEKTLAALKEAVRGPKRSATGRSASEEFMDRTVRAMQSENAIPGASTGVDEIDMISGGMKPGEFWVIGGRPSRGKSVLMLQVAAAFIQRKEPVSVFSLEMMRHEVVGRLVTVLGGIDYGKITQPKRLETKYDLIHVRNAVEQLADTPLWIDDSANQSIDSILNEATRIRDAHGSLGLVVVDYLQLIRGRRNRGESREEEVARVSGGLKQLAKEIECPVISATQLNEEGRSRESRAIEQDADACFYIGDNGIKVVKLRNARRDDLLPLLLQGEMQRFNPYQP
jgi:replicative DNA helicase